MINGPPTNCTLVLIVASRWEIIWMTHQKGVTSQFSEIALLPVGSRRPNGMPTFIASYLLLKLQEHDLDPVYSSECTHKTLYYFARKHLDIHHQCITDMEGILTSIFLYIDYSSHICLIWKYIRAVSISENHKDEIWTAIHDYKSVNISEHQWWTVPLRAWDGLQLSHSNTCDSYFKLS